ncbi:MAG: type I secretion system permease/ATPase [Pseudomonadota bacterium]
MKKFSFFSRSELAAVLWTFRREFLVVGVFSFVINLLALSPTLYMLQIYDRVLASRSDVTLVFVSLLTLFFFFVMAFAEWSRSRLLVRAGVLIDARLSTRIFNASFESHLMSAGGNPSRAFGDLINIRQFITGQGIFAFFDAPWTPIYMVVLFFLHPWLGVLGLFFALVQVALAWFGHRHTHAPTEAATQAANEAQMFLLSKLRNAELLESMGMIRNLRNLWSHRHKAALHAASHAYSINHRVTGISKFIRYGQQSLVLGAGALLVIDGQLSPGGMIAANVLVGKALAPIDQIVSSWRAFISARLAFQRLETLMDEFPARDEVLSRMPPTGSLRLENVVASASGRTTPILDNVNVTIPSGAVVAVIGPSGSGKSTLARVMIGIWPDVSGEVLLDEMPIAKWNRFELGPHLGYLPQDIELFEGSIAENISRFSEVDSELVIAAARSAGLHDMILRFPQGYNTQIGDAGNLLSGGQRQRIGLARAVYGNPALVILDEPNANLDDAGEQALSQTIAELKANGRTVIIVTHRSAAIAAADYILVMQQGRIVASGPRNDVIRMLQGNGGVTSPASSSPSTGTSALPA